MKILSRYVVLLALLGLVPHLAFGAVFMSGEETVAPADPIDDDLYIAGNTIQIDQPVSEDVFAAGNSVTIKGAIEQDVHAAGNTVFITGTVGDDIFAAGNSVALAVPGSDDVFAAGNKVTIDEETVVNGDSYFGGQQISVSGTFKGTVRTAGDIVTIRRGTTIEGDLLSFGPNEPLVEDGVTIGGKKEHRLEDSFEPKPQQQIAAWVRNVIAWFIAGVLALYVLPQFTRSVLTFSTRERGKALGVGVLCVALCIPLTIFFFITLIGWPIALLIVLLTITMFLLAPIFVSIALGEAVMKGAFKVTSALSWQHVLLGVIVFQGLQVVPIIGPLATIVLVLWGVGAVALTLWRQFRPATANPPA